MGSMGCILVVDDSQDVLRFVCEVLADEGFAVVGARNGIDALALAAKSHPDLILLDMQMPLMDGWDFVRAYRKTPGPHATIVVMAAGRASASHAAEIGAAGYLAKPFSLEHLLELAERYAGRASPAA